MLNTLKSDNLSFIIHTAMNYKPTILNNTIIKRRNCTFLYIIEGAYSYTFDNENFIARKGDIVYIPFGTSYKYNVLTLEQTHCMQIEFSMIDRTTKGTTRITTKPCLLPKISSTKIFDIFSNIISLQTDKNIGYDFAINSYINLLLYFWISELNYNTTIDKRIIPAVKYIKENYTKKIYVSYLASLCFISEAQLWRIFHNTLNVSPIEYKNRLLFANACDLLKDSKNSISEISNSLGFDSVYKFSQLFKKRYGESPLKFRKSNTSYDHT